MKGVAFRTLFFIIVAVAVLAIILIWWAGGSAGIEEYTKNLIIPLSETNREIIDMSIGYKAIHVVMFPSVGSSPPDIYQFHFTDQFNHITYKDGGDVYRFNLKPWDDVISKYCVLYTSRRGSHIFLKNWVYYVPSGSLITSSTVSLAPFAINVAECECGRCGEAKAGYNTLCSTKGYPMCRSNEDVLSQQFTSGVTDKCDEDETIEGACPEVNGKADCCHLLKTTGMGTHEYKVRYPLLCGFAEGDTQAKWYACSEKLKGETIYTATGDELKCNGNDWEVVKGDLSIQAARLEYNYPWALDYQTKLEFWVTNFRTSDLNNVNITVDVMDTNFCGESGIAGWWCSYGPGRDKNHSSVSISSLPKKSIYKFEEDDFCYKSVIPGQGATDFEVNISWSSGSKTESKTFCIRFKPKSCSEGSYAFPQDYTIKEGGC